MLSICDPVCVLPVLRHNAISAITPIAANDYGELFLSHESSLFALIARLAERYCLLRISMCHLIRCFVCRRQLLRGLPAWMTVYLMG